MGADYSITTIHKVKVKVSMMTETFCMLNISKFFVQTLLAHILFSYVALICCSKQQLQQHVFTRNHGQMCASSCKTNTCCTQTHKIHHNDPHLIVNLLTAP